MVSFWRIGASLAALGVAAGAFGAHGLRDRVTPDLLAVWETAARYHLIHALALVILGVAAPSLRPGPARVAGWLLCAGVLLFSGSLYVMTLTGERWLGAVTPLGGVSFITGWLTLAWAGAPAGRAP